MTRLIGKKASSADAHNRVALIPSLPLLTLYPCTQLPMKTGHKTERELREQMAGGTQIRNCSSIFLTNGIVLMGYMILSIMGEMQCMWLFSNDLQGSGSWGQFKDTLNAAPFAATLCSTRSPGGNVKHPSLVSPVQLHWTYPGEDWQKDFTRMPSFQDFKYSSL